MKTNLETLAKGHPKHHAAVANGAPSHTQSSMANIPWQERSAGCSDVVWRYKANPIIGRQYLPGVQGVYNSAVAPYGDGFVGVFRLEKRSRFPHLHIGWSDDGIDWQIE